MALVVILCLLFYCCASTCLGSACCDKESLLYINDYIHRTKSKKDICFNLKEGNVGRCKKMGIVATLGTVHCKNTLVIKVIKSIYSK